MYILGDSFLRAWYSIYDFENNRVGVVQTHDSIAQIVTYFPTWAIVLIVLISIAGVAGISYYFYNRH